MNIRVTELRRQAALGRCSMPCSERSAAQESGKPTRLGRTSGGAAFALLVGVAWLAGCSDLTPVLGCESGVGIQVDCQFRNPEDLALAPDGRILASQFGGLEGEAPGSLALYDPATRTLTPAFPPAAPADVDAYGGEAEWGDANCPAPDLSVFSPHGIDIETRADGRRQLAVVNHGGRESVELFEVGDDAALTWRGCALAPEDALLNDVVLLQDGSFWVTHMFPRSSSAFSMLKATLFDANTGWVYAWSQGQGFRKLPGTDAPVPNGIEKSGDERYLYLNAYAAQGIRKIDAATGEVVAARELPSLDNSTWGEDGRLLVASHTGGLGEVMACQGLEAGACGMPFEIVALDPNDLSEQVLIAHQGPPMGGATVALQREGVFWLGTFAGDRIGMVDLGAPALAARE